LSGISHAVFISYASQDAEAAQKLCGALRAAGIEVFLDQGELRGGDAWDHKIKREIHDCALFIPIVSQHTQERLEGYFRYEWNLAIERIHHMAQQKPFLVPVVIDGTRDQEAFVPDAFRAVQWTRLPAGETPPAFVERIKCLLSRELSTLSPVSGATAAIREPVRTTRRSKPMLLATVALVVFAALAYIVADKFWISKHLAPAPTAFAPPPHSIAVLPFVNMSGDSSQAYFSDGVSEELLNALSRLNDLQVIARTSSFSFKGQNVDVPTIARKLNVGAILEGSVRRSGNTVRITVQLINAVSGFHIWSQTYDRESTDILKVQSDVATSVAQQLEAQLVGNEIAKMELGGTQNAEAYDAYLRGMQLYYTPDTRERDYEAAVAAFDQAIALDPNYAAAYSRRAGALLRLYNHGTDPSVRASLHAQARAAAERAVVLAPELGEAHLALAFTHEIGARDFAEAAREFNRALALSPGSAWVQGNFALFASQMGHFQPAVTAARRAVSLDPRNPWAHVYLAGVFIHAHRYREGLSALQDARMFDPESHEINGDIINSLLASGEIERARQACESASTPLNDDDRYFYLALAYHALGRQADAERELQQYKVLDGDGGSYGYAAVYAQWGDKTSALKWLEKAEQLNDPAISYLLVDWPLDPIRNEPQFKALAARMNFPP
jgi:TolB-like protein/Flp pilus assembly protein TadD